MAGSMNKARCVGCCIYLRKERNGVFSTGDCCIPGYFQEQGQNFKLPGIKVGGWAQGRRQLGMQRESRDLCRKGANWPFIKHLTHQ